MSALNAIILQAVDSYFCGVVHAQSITVQTIERGRLRGALPQLMTIKSHVNDVGCKRIYTLTVLYLNCDRKTI